MFKRISSVILVVALICSSISLRAFANSEISVSNRPDLPTAIITQTGMNCTVQAMNGLGGEVSETPVTFTMNFTAVEPNESQIEFYDKWYADFELTTNKDIRGVDGYLVGQYDFYSDYWVKLGDETNTNVIINADEPFKIMTLMNMKMNYNDIYSFVKNFDCGIYLTPEFLEANPDFVLTLELKMYNNHDESESYVIGETYTFTCEDIPNYHLPGSDDGTFEDAIKDAIENAGEQAPEIVIDVQENTQKPDETAVSINVSEIKKVQSACKDDSTNANASLAIKSDVANITFNNAALENIVKDSVSDNHKLELKVEKIENPADVDISKKAVVIDITLKVNNIDVGDKLAGTNNGFVTITLQAPKDVANGEEVIIYYINGAQKQRIADTTVVDGFVTFETTHFSIYSIEGDDSNPAKIGDTEYATLKEAIDAATATDTIYLIRDYKGSGIVIDKDVTIDFDGFTYCFTQPPVGSNGTQSNGFQILKDNNVVLKNGTLNIDAQYATEYGMVIQNYANLTLTDMVLDGTYLDKRALTTGYSYVLSNNSGTVNINGATKIIANDDGDKAFAFDVCKYSSYNPPVVYINTTQTIFGNFEVSEEIKDNLIITSGNFTQNVSNYVAEDSGTIFNGEKWLVDTKDKVADINNDNQVNSDDAQMLSKKLLNVVVDDNIYDINADGIFDIRDLVTVKSIAIN